MWPSCTAHTHTHTHTHFQTVAYKITRAHTHTNTHTHTHTPHDQMKRNYCSASQDLWTHTHTQTHSHTHTQFSTCFAIRVTTRVALVLIFCGLHASTCFHCLQTKSLCVHVFFYMLLFSCVFHTPKKSVLCPSATLGGGYLGCSHEYVPKSHESQIKRREKDIGLPYVIILSKSLVLQRYSWQCQWEDASSSDRHLNSQLCQKVSCLTAPASCQ